jgi:hypothetical protein
MTEDPVRDAIDEAAERLRDANHAHMRADRGHEALYVRLGELTQLLTKLDQTIRDARDDADQIRGRADHYDTDDGIPARSHAQRALDAIATAALQVGHARQDLDKAWGAIGHLIPKEA